MRADPGEITGVSTLNGLSSRYLKDGPPVLKGLDLHIEAGEFVARGRSSGRASPTLIRLLLGFDQRSREASSTTTRTLPNWTWGNCGGRSASSSRAADCSPGT